MAEVAWREKRRARDRCETKRINSTLLLCEDAEIRNYTLQRERERQGKHGTHPQDNQMVKRREWKEVEYRNSK